jgi:hypothetical protein
LTFLTISQIVGIASTVEGWGRFMAAIPDRPRFTFMQWVAAERLALIFGAFAFPVLAIALGICLAILANALR